MGKEQPGLMGVSKDPAVECAQPPLGLAGVPLGGAKANLVPFGLPPTLPIGIKATLVSPQAYK